MTHRAPPVAPPAASGTTKHSAWSFWCVTTCYQGFTLSDGALRMLVLLHLHELGRTPLALVLVLLPYRSRACSPTCSAAGSVRASA